MAFSADTTSGTDWDAAYEKLLEENASVRKKVESANATKEDVIAWMKVAVGKSTDKKSVKVAGKSKPGARPGSVNFYAIVIGKLKSKDVELGELEIEVDYVISDNSEVKDSIVGNSKSISSLLDVAREDGYVKASQWYDWIYARVAANKPYDKLVEGIVLADLSSESEGMPYFWTRQSLQEPEDTAQPPLKEKRSAIFIFMEGAPSHQDTFDLKPNAPVEVRGEFNPISANAVGVQICEHLPMLAQRADKFAVIRGITHNVADHGLAKKYLLTGNKASQTVSYPEYGSVVSHEYPSAAELPTYVSIDESFVGPGYLGSRYSPLTAEKPRHGMPYTVRGVTLEDGLTIEQYKSQKELLDDLDTVFRGYEDLDDQVRGMDRFSQQAFNIISSPQARSAFDLSKEQPEESDRFGKHEFGQSLLLAARLIEAGVHFVTVRLRPAEFDFDTHADNFSRLRALLPPLDRGLAALLDRLEERGLLQSTAIMAAGEFGRTPKINQQGAQSADVSRSTLDARFRRVVFSADSY